MPGNYAHGCGLSKAIWAAVNISVCEPARASVPGELGVTSAGGENWPPQSTALRFATRNRRALDPPGEFDLTPVGASSSIDGCPLSPSHEVHRDCAGCATLEKRAQGVLDDQHAGGSASSLTRPQWARHFWCVQGERRGVRSQLRCPRCHTRGTLRRSHLRFLETPVKWLSPMRPFRCRHCYKRSWHGPWRERRSVRRPVAVR